MRIPQVFFGTSSQVRGSFRKLVTQVRRGATLEAFFREVPELELDDHPGSMLIMATRRSGSGLRECVRIDQLSRVLESDERGYLVLEEVAERSVEYLASTAWGCLVLNTPMSYFWARGTSSQGARRAYIAILRSTIAHWEAFVALGRRFYVGSTAVTFPEMAPLSGWVAAQCGINPRGGSGERGWSRIAEACVQANIVERLASDDAYWREVARGGFVGAPPALDEPEELKRRCHEGTWRAHYWDRLRELAGVGAVQTALADLEQRRDWNALLGVYVHVLGDMRCAAELLLAHGSSGSSLEWAREIVVEKLASTDPLLTAALLFQEAEMHLGFGTREVYVAAANRLHEARALLSGEVHDHMYRERIADFRMRYGHLSQLMALLDKRGVR